VTADLAALALGVVSVLVLVAARSPRVAAALVRVPRRWRDAAVGRPASARAIAGATLLLAWVIAFGAVGHGTGKTLGGIAVGGFVGLIIGAAATMAVSLALQDWESSRSPLSDVTLPPRSWARCAADLPTPEFTPGFPEVAAMARSSNEQSRAERIVRWIRNGAATGVLILAPAPHLDPAGDGTGSTVLGLVVMETLAVVGLAFCTLAIIRRRRDRLVRHAGGADVTLDRLCAAHGWRRGSVTATQLRLRFPRVPFFLPDKDHRVRTFLRGAMGPYPLSIVDERGEPAGRWSTLMREMRQTVYVISLPGTHLPALSVCARHTRFLPHQRANRKLELETFNRRFHVECADPRFASAVLTPRMITVLMHQLPPGAQFAVAGDAVAVVVPGRLRPWMVESHVTCLVDASRLLPDYLLRDHASGVSGPARVPS
jgi:hypothetical protein